MNLNFTNSVLYPDWQPIKHRVGNVYHIEDDGSFHAVLSQVGENLVALICLENNANRYSKPVKVKFIRDISPKEFVKLSGNFDYRPQVEIVYIGRVEDVLKVIAPLTSDELLLNKIFGDEDKNVIPGS